MDNFLETLQPPSPPACTKLMAQVLERLTNLRKVFDRYFIYRQKTVFQQDQQFEYSQNWQLYLARRAA